jgi:hypothetical protein
LTSDASVAPALALGDKPSARDFAATSPATRISAFSVTSRVTMYFLLSPHASPNTRFAARSTSRKNP